MTAKYQRLRKTARDADPQIQELEEETGVGSAAEMAVMERRLGELVIKRGSLANPVILMRSVNSDGFRERQQRRCIRTLPQQYH